jgi:hypothetical protein
MASATSEQNLGQSLAPRSVQVMASPEHPYQVPPGSQDSVMTSRVAPPSSSVQAG